MPYSRAIDAMIKRLEPISPGEILLEESNLISQTGQRSWRVPRHFCIPWPTSGTLPRYLIAILPEHPELQKLRHFGVTEEQLDQFQVLSLPENLLAAARAEDLLDAQDGIDLVKRLKEAGVVCATSLDLTPAAATVRRRGGDLWLGILWIHQSNVAPLFAKTLQQKLKSWSDRNSLRKENWKVHLRLRIRQAQDIAELAYVGDGQTLSHLLNGLIPDGMPT
jgi:hypothetical protein